MTKGNNILPNNHFRKHWTRFVKTWYNQPAAKRRRQERRQRKALGINNNQKIALSPRPISLLRPVVRGQTIKYNGVQKLGKGFSLIELKEAGLNSKFARTIGVAVDHRRRNDAKEELDFNVKRLKTYLSKLVLFPRVAGKAKKGVVADNDKAATVVVNQNTNPEVLTFQRRALREKAQIISKELKSVHVFRKLRQEWYNAKFVGVKQKRREKKAAEQAKKN
ncbi:hypothetical protein pb186bvf_016161 [Paramecium bursaria]